MVPLPDDLEVVGAISVQLVRHNYYLLFYSSADLLDFNSFLQINIYFLQPTIPILTKV